MAYRVKTTVKDPDDPKKTEERRKALRALIEKHGGRDDTRKRPGKFVAATFPSRAAAAAYKTAARAYRG